MNFKIDRDVLIKYLKMVGKVLPTKTPHLTLEGILLTVDKEQLTLKASDSDVTLELAIPCEVNETQVLLVEEVGSYIIPGKKFIDVISSAKQNTIHIQLVPKGLQIKCGRSKIVLAGMDPELYPTLGLVGEILQTIELETKDLLEVIDFVGPFVLNNESRPVLGGILLEFGNGLLKATATDAFRLSQHTLELPMITKETSIVVPNKTFKDIYKMLELEKNKITLEVFENQLLIKTSIGCVITRLLSASEYPTVTNLIPTSFNNVCQINRMEFLDALEHAALIGELVKFSFKENGTLLLQSMGKTVDGDFEEEVSIDQTMNQLFDIAFNIKYLQSILKTIEAETVVFESNGTNRVCVIRALNIDNSLRLIVPVRLD